MSISNNKVVVSSAFEELSRFDRLQFKCSYMPEPVKTKDHNNKNIIKALLKKNY
jgi:hypothetical protein